MKDITKVRIVKGALLPILSMLSIIIITALNDLEIIVLNQWVHILLIGSSFFVTLYFIRYLFVEVDE